MRFDVITLFEPMFSALLEHGITGRALKRNLFEFQAWNPRDFTADDIEPWTIGLMAVGRAW
jgi:tRNA (guanine37-N1)-methyltransferase